MNRKALLFAVLILGCAVTSVMADADVRAVRLTHGDGETVFKVEAEGVFQYSHQMEEAKNGKPFRVVVDIFPAVHQLGQKAFYELPPSVITSIRTSQYAVTPEKVVRLVLDLKQEAAYRIEKEGKTLFIYIPDETSGVFTDWCSHSEKKSTSPKPSQRSASKTVAVKPAPDKAVEPKKVTSSKVKPSVKSKKSPEMVQTPSPEPSKVMPEAVVTTAPKPVAEVLQPQVTTYHLAQQSRPWEAEMAQWAPVVRPAPKPAVENPPSKSPVEVAEVEKDKPVQPTPVKVEPKSEPPTQAAPVKAVDTATQPSQSDRIEEKKATPSEPVQDKKPGSTKDKVFTKKKKTYSDTEAGATTEADKKKSTSRFRRNPVIPAKLKGTIVAEFPTRMVIKYSPGTYRDPFKTLIDDAKQSDSPVGKKTPDVETLRLVGVLESQSGKNRALLEDLDGYGYILKQGDKVKKGYVSRIDPNRAYFQLFEYGWSRSVALDLGDE